MKKQQLGFTLPELIMGVAALLSVAMSVAIGYIIVHFVMKFW